MHMKNKLFVLFCGFLWVFGFITGLIIRDSSVSCDSLLYRNTRTHINPPPLISDDDKPNLDHTNNHQHSEVVNKVTPSHPTPNTSVPDSVSTSSISHSPHVLQPLNQPGDNCLIFQNHTLSMDKFSIIIPTYKRVKLLKQVLENYCSLQTHVDTIIVVWNNIKEAIPKEIKELSCKVKLVLKTPSVNSLNNRFIRYPEIRTQGMHNLPVIFICSLCLYSYYTKTNSV